MGKLSLIFPELQEPSKTADPRTRTALKAIETIINGELNTENLQNEGIAEVDLNTAVKALLNAKVSGLTLVQKSANFTAASGELVEVLTTGNTITLPTPTAGTTVCVYASGTATNVKVTAPGTSKIFGDFITGSTSVNLAQFQHITVYGDGTNYLIIAGTPAPTVVGTPGSAGPNIASWGLIGSAGAIEAGSGDYTVSNPSEGKYIITWKTAKASASYAVVATAASLTGGAGAIPVAVVPTITTKEFVAELYTPGGAHVSDKFSFIVMAAS